MKLASIVTALSFALAAGCATGISLTGPGEQVQHVSSADVPVGCNLLGDVAIGIPPDAARPRTEEQLVILMRNKAAELGGSHVILESKSQEEGSSGEAYWRGRGIAYACPEEASEGPAETGGGEAPDEASEPMEEETSEDEGSAVDDDPLVDDLL